MSDTPKKGYVVDSNTRAAVERVEAAKALFEEFGIANFRANIDIANILKSTGEYPGAVHFFDFAYQINTNSKDALLAKLLTQLEGGIMCSDVDVEALERLDPNCARFMLAKQKIKAGEKDPRKILEVLRDCFEAFRSGSEPEWIFVRTARELLASTGIDGVKSAIPPVVDAIPRRVFIYWDKSPPPEIEANFEYHRQLGNFDVNIYDKEMTTDFLYQVYGAETKKFFLKCQHPSEESDFFRIHAINAFGGYYLDADCQIISWDIFREDICSLGADSVFLLSSSGPIYSGFFGSVANSPMMEECLRVLLYNSFEYPNLSLWLKSGPGPITRAIVRAYYRHIFQGARLPSFKLLPETAYPRLFRAIDVSYRNDVRDWRVFEAGR